ncbi:beta-galactosidase [uncultured Prevotella sp.]|uniref:beta-galactosidase n=1 Tax=uncultured Prevotella sp. TaxID=159272 RepID=UPI0025D9EE71|nr:beta-galactosidase [uncultured Prevotella sp.]
MKKKFISLLCLLMACIVADAQGNVAKPVVTWDQYSLMMDGKRVVPVMGEIHYSRLPANEWQQEVRKMKEGGVTMIATYVFWNHIEEEEGIFRWDGQRDLRRFLEICKEEDVPVVLRLGPFCHGEVRNGGIPDWMFTKGCRMRDRNAVFMGYAEKLYRQIFTQVQGLQWKDGGPVIAAQFDNEYRGRGEYLVALKEIATKIGFDLPFYTRTGWPELATPVPFGEMLPLYGDYADGFWDRSLQETAGNYYQAFNFKAFRSSTAIATEQIDYSQSTTHPSPVTSQEYPYFTCELGGGMMQAYHRRPYLYADDAYSMALVKLGSGSNLLGYYMYHGGTNPEGKTYLNENQRTQATNYNDMPVKNYDFQAPLGEFGQRNESFYRLRPLHLFMQDWGELLAPMEASFPSPQDIKKGDDSQLRWAVRSEKGKVKSEEFAAALGTSDQGRAASAFVFVNNYERLQNLSAKKDVVLEACGVKLPKLTIPSGCMAIFPVNVDGIKYATAQLVAKRDGKLFLMQVPGIPTTICMQDGKVLKNVKARGEEKPVYQNIYLLTQYDAERLFLAGKGEVKSREWTAEKVKEAGPLRQIPIGVQKVAEEPTDEDFEQAAVYRIQVPGDRSSLLRITYQGDCARLYANGKLVADHFQYGRPMLYGLWRLPEGCNELELRILPLQKDAPVYLPREAEKTPGERLVKVELTNEGL